MKLYLSVTSDKYELPLYVAKSPRELAEVYGIKESSVLERIARKETGEKKGYKFLRIDVGENIWG